jgi:parallel beta-helix repeat protein
MVRAVGTQASNTSTVPNLSSKKRRLISLVFVFALFFSAVAALQLTPIATANMMSSKISPIYIRSDGSIEAADSLLSRVEDVYTLTGSSVPSFGLMGIGGFHVHTIVIERGNIVLDGGGYELNGPGSQPWTAVTISGQTNVTVKNLEICNFQVGIGVSGSANITITRNNIVSNDYGVTLASSNYSVVSENNLKGNYYEISLVNSFDNSICGNVISSWESYTPYSSSGFHLSYSSNNTFLGNNVTALGQGVTIEGAVNNSFFQNNFVNNSIQIKGASSSATIPPKNLWNYGTMGNFWSDYAGEDRNHDGIGDTPYIIDVTNVDSYPAMNAFGVNPVVLPAPLDKEIDHSQQTANQTLSPSPTAPPAIPANSSAQAFISMPQEYINYTVSSINGSLWATVDGVYPLHISPELVGQQMQMVYPTPTGTTPDIKIAMDGQELSWSNYTAVNSEALHYTYLGEWPMVACTIVPTATDFLLTIHYQHPIMQANGSYLFLYDLNINPYLSETSERSTAHFTICFEANCSDIHVYNVPGDSSIPQDSTMTPVEFTLNQINGTQTATFNITSDYSKPVPGDQLVIFQGIQVQAPEFPSWIILPLTTIATLFTALFAKRKSDVDKQPSKDFEAPP